MYKYFSFVILLFLDSIVFSQNIQRSSIFNAGGSYAVSGTIQVQSNIGELMSSTFIGSTNVLSQGFIQPDALLTVVVENVDVIEANIFPNPVVDQLFVEFDVQHVGALQIEVYTLLGQKMEVSNHFSDKGCILNFEALPAGIYFVKITSLDKKINKIVKVNNC